MPKKPIPEISLIYDSDIQLKLTNGNGRLLDMLVVLRQQECGWRWLCFIHGRMHQTGRGATFEEARERAESWFLRWHVSSILYH